MKRNGVAPSLAAAAGVAAALWFAAMPATAAAMTVAELFGSLKPGQWMALEGTPQANQTVLCNEAKIMTGDLLEDDWAVRAVVKSLDAQKQRVNVHHLAIRMSEDIEYHVLNKFADIKTGMLIDAGGTFMKDGTFLAKDLEDESEKLKRKPQWQTRIKFTGRVGKVDVTRRRITMMGSDFVLNDQTRVMSIVK